MDPYDKKLELYLDTLERSPQPIPTIEEIKAAVVAFCPFDPRTGNMLAEKSDSSLCVLTRILYLPYYPKMLGIINNQFFVAKCLLGIENYLQHHKASFSCLSLWVLELTVTQAL